MKRGFPKEQTPLFLTLLAIQAEDGEGSGHPSKSQPPPSSTQHIQEEQILTIVSSTHQKTQIPRQALNKDTELPCTSVLIPNVPDETVYEEWDDSVERATTTAASLDVAQDSGNILNTQSTAMPNVPLPQGIGTSGSPRCQETTRGSIAQTRPERVPTPPHDLPLLRVSTLGSDEGNAAKKKVNTYTRRRRAVSTGSEGVSTASRIFSTAEEPMILDEELAQKLYEEEQARFNAEQEANFNAEQGELLRFDKDDPVRLWDLVKERFSTTEPTDDKEKALWVELKRLFEPDNDDIIWKLQRYMHDPLVWRLYDTCGVHHVSTERRDDIFMLVEKEYPLTQGLMIVMMANKLQMDQSSKMANELIRKIFILANRPRQ
uniref:Uncharacterized protein n=1 Tax=Tanacetum cinerariifolium TaxID=118510 RepID=A0A6L2MH22_TANCI|nr:hypothetical protein [Tanacetum cinerariifolium]